jgi:hypothetical protein
MVTKDQLNRYLSVIFRPLPGLIINTANSQRDVGGECMYNRSADSS